MARHRTRRCSVRPRMRRSSDGLFPREARATTMQDLETSPQQNLEQQDRARRIAPTVRKLGQERGRKLDRELRTPLPRPETNIVRQTSLILMRGLRILLRPIPVRQIPEP